MALLLIDLDNFKEVNDTVGHSFGDELLLKYSKDLKALIRNKDFVARLGGDEFAVIVEESDAQNWALELSNEIVRNAENSPIIVDGHQFSTASSIGISVYPQDGENAESLMANADLALYRAKEDQKCKNIFFAPEMRSRLLQRRKIESDLDVALTESQFRLFYQPQFRLRDDKFVGIEALIRWQHPERGLIPPSQFMDVVNAGTISDRVGYWVLETACRQAQVWNQMGYPLRTGVNLSQSQFRSINLVQIVQDVLYRTELPNSLLELEVTENILLEQEKHAEEILHELRLHGVSIAFDDFGTGYASLSYLKNFPLDRIKIDRSFVRDIFTDRDSQAIVRAILALSKLMNLEVIAEGIENKMTLELLEKLDCTEGQGYYFGKPMEAWEIELMLNNGMCISDKFTQLRATAL